MPTENGEQEYMNQAELYEELTKKILGDELFDDCFRYFKNILVSRCKYKIILTRRSFSLFKIFRVILNMHGITPYGIIITDNAIPLFLSDLQNELINKTKEDAISILIIDDIIIYGRTINKILTEILNTPNSESRNQIHVMCIVKNSGSCLKPEYEDLVLSYYGASSLDWKRYSYIFSKLIKALDISNTSYIVSYRNRINDTFNEFLEFCTKEMCEVKNNELECMSVLPRALSVSFGKGHFCGLVRVYIYEELESFLIAPLFILPDLNNYGVKKISNFITKEFCEGADTIEKFLTDNNESLYESKLRMITLILSHTILLDFMRQHNLNLSNIDNYDYDEIIKHNFGASFLNDFEKINNNILNLNTKLFDYESRGIYDKTNKFENYIFDKAMQDNWSARIDNNKRRDGFNKMNEESLLSKKYAANLMNVLDNGLAALRIASVEKKFYSLIYSGEQAFRICYDIYKDFLPIMHCIENISYIYNMNSYILYKDYLDYIKKRNMLTSEQHEEFMKYINVLEKNKQHPSDVMIDDNLENKIELLELLKGFIEERGVTQ